jgi:antiviral helicase SLH1
MQRVLLAHSSKSLCRGAGPKRLLRYQPYAKLQKVRYTCIAVCLGAKSPHSAERLWPWAHPLEQMSLQADLLYNLNRWAEDMSIEDIVAETSASLGKIIHLNERLGGVAIQAARQFPRLRIESQMQPLSHDLLRVRLAVHRDFVWSEKHHGQTQYFWVWVSDAEDRDILQSRKLIYHESSRSMQVDFTISLAILPASLNIRTLSDTWLSSESILPLSLNTLTLPPVPDRPRKLLDLSNFSAQMESDLYELVRPRSVILSAFELQCMHSIYSSSANVLVCAPLGQARQQLVSTAVW